MARLPKLFWIESSPTSILEPTSGAWFSGRAIDLLHLGSDGLLVGTETGGLWAADGAGGSRPLSDGWAYPNVTCIVQRPTPDFPPFSFLCGTQGALYRNKPSLTDPFAEWETLNLPDGVSVVNRIVTLPASRVVITTDRGIWWAEFGLGGTVQWRQAFKRERAFVGFTDVPIADAWYGLAHTGIAEVVVGTQSGVVADPIGHSLSPLIHNAAFAHFGMNKVYVPFRVPREDLERQRDAGP